MSAPTITDLDITKIHGLFLIKTYSGSCYQLMSEARSDGRVLLSGGKKDMKIERVTSYRSVIRIGSKMFFWRLDGTPLRSTDVTHIIDITGMDDASIARLMES
jgi:hypothetical protein